MKINPAFKPYQSKPVTRYAHQIEDADELTKVGEATYAISLHDEMVEFKAYEPPVAGDFIVWLKDDHIYHCSRAVFHERNHVED